MADFTLNAVGSAANPYTPASIIVPRGTLQRDTNGMRRGSGFPMYAHDANYGDTITSAITVQAYSSFDYVLVGAVVRTGANAGAFVGVILEESTGFRIVVINPAGTTIVSSNLLTGQAAVTTGDVFAVTYNKLTGAVTATRNGSNLAFTGTTSDSTYAGESTLAAGGGFDAQNSNASYVSLFEGTGIAATAPALSTPVTPTNASTVGAGFTASFTTNTNSGTGRIVIDSSANLSGVTAAQVLAGQKANGSSAAYDSGNITVSTTTPSYAFTGLASGTYTVAAAQNSSGGNSAVLTWTIVVDATAPSFSSGPSLTAVSNSQYTVIGTSNETGTAKIIATEINASQPNNAAFDALVVGVSSDAVNITSGVQFQITH